MRTNHFLKFGLGLIVILGLGLASYKTFAHSQKTKSRVTNSVTSEIISNEQVTQEEEPDADITMTMDSNATDSNIEEIKKMLKAYHIYASFSNIERNGTGKITGIKIELNDENNGQAVTQISSFAPIANISFGRKDGMLFIYQEGNEMMNRFSSINSLSPFFANDSLFEKQFGLLKKFNIQDFFNNSSPSMAFGVDILNFDEFEKQILEKMNTMGNQKQFTFIDNPHTNKLIIIDGKESDFETLDKLANEKKIVAIDGLKPETAMSIYGNKAKDGALIISTK